MTNYIERYWREATPEDAIKEPPMVARFRNHSEVEWTKVPLRLMGLCRASCAWFDIDGDTFDYCQVYDVPDPGEGWRLIDVEKERPQEGDEIWAGHKWSSMEYFMDFCLPNHYRRRVEQPKPEPRYEPFKWEDREQLRGRWIGSNDGRWEKFVAVMYHESEFFWVNGINAESLCADWRFMDTGEPVGRRVQ